MKLSVIIPCYNERNTICDIVAAAEGAPFEDKEIIIVDDGSTDGSAEMVRAEFPEVTLAVNQQNIGVAKSYNKGVALARGRYVQMLNTDMVLVNNAIKILFDFLEGHPEAGACAGGAGRAAAGGLGAGGVVTCAPTRLWSAKNSRPDKTIVPAITMQISVTTTLRIPKRRRNGEVIRVVSCPIAYPRSMPARGDRPRPGSAYRSLMFAIQFRLFYAAAPA